MNAGPTPPGKSASGPRLSLLIDTADFTRRSDSARGELHAQHLPRLSSSVQAMETGLSWSLQGSMDSTAQALRVPMLHLELSGSVRMVCVRCLEPVSCRLEVKRSFRLAVSESQAEREDREDEDYDVLVGDRRFDVGALIEDEALLALPFAPSHASCEVPHPVSGEGEAPVAPEALNLPKAPDALDTAAPDPPSADQASERPHPFAVLARLRRPS